MCAFVLTRIDYCNSVLANLPDCALAPLQRVLHAAARFVADLGPRDHVTSTLVALATSPSTNHLQTVHYDAFSVLCNIYISNIVTPVTHLPRRAHLVSAINGDFNTRGVTRLPIIR